MTTTMIIIPQGATPPPFGVTPNFEHPEDVLSTFNFVACTVVIGLMAVFVAIRLVIRVFVTRTMDKDDCMILLISSTFCLQLLMTLLIKFRYLCGCMGKFYFWPARKSKIPYA